MPSLSLANCLKSNEGETRSGTGARASAGRRRSRAAAALALALCVLEVRTASATDVGCDIEGDGAGWTIAADADFDGDGIFDLAVGAPCSRIGSAERVGRVIVYSGATERRLLVVAGTVAGQKFGGAISFVGDLSGDGLPDLVVGSPAWPVTLPGGQVKAAQEKSRYSRATARSS